MMLSVKIVSLLLLASHGTCSILYQRDASVIGTLFPRQEEVSEPLSCSLACEINTCGAGSCSLPGASSLVRRSSGVDNLLNSYSLRNGSSVLAKRLFRYNTNSNQYTGDREPTIREVDSYLPAVFTLKENDHFGQPLAIVSGGDERAYSQERTFGNRAFQIISGGIHGCTVAVLVSNRAVWMAHFWETYSHATRKSDGEWDNLDTPKDAPAFVDRVLKFIRGDPVPIPADSKKPYIAPTGPSPTASLYDNIDEDETKLFIFTPIGDNQRLRASARLKYPQRVDEIEKAFVARIGVSPAVYRVGYKRLDYTKPDEAALENQSNRGMTLFQYDPDSDGKGRRAWRLFLENRYFDAEL